MELLLITTPISLLKELLFQYLIVGMSVLHLVVENIKKVTRAVNILTVVILHYLKKEISFLVRITLGKKEVHKII